VTAAAPSWVVTFLFTDVESSTSRWEADAEGMRSALAPHDEVLRSAIETHGGFLLKRTRRRYLCGVQLARVRSRCRRGA
jgi:class 3 adenylate cyclase